MLGCAHHGLFKVSANSILSGRRVNPCDGCRAQEWVLSTVDRFVKAHGDKYDYSLVSYPRNDQDYQVSILCKHHGVFVTPAYSHLQGRGGCPHCATEANRLGQEAFLTKAKDVHNGRYDYGKVVYEHGRKAVVIVCPVHGEFKQLPQVHLSGSGCKACFTDKHRSNTSEFVSKARTLHGDKYDYDKVVYTTSKVKVEIVCKDHGSFWMTPNSHLADRQGCRRCRESKGEIRIRQFLELHGIRFDQEYRLGLSRYRYDFFLSDLGVLIEFQGQQHFRPIEVFGGQAAFEETQKRDFIKNKLATKYKLKLLKPDYLLLKEDRLERFLKRHLLKADSGIMTGNKKCPRGPVMDHK